MCSRIEIPKKMFFGWYAKTGLRSSQSGEPFFEISM